MFSHPSFTFSLPPVSQRGQSATSDDVAEADRLEFVGDVLISGPVAVMLYELHRKGTPNDYSKLKAVLTCNAFFANLMVRVGFVCRDGSPRIKEFADALEASVGLYLKDRGSQAVEDWVWDNFCPLVEVALSIYQEHTNIRDRHQPYFRRTRVIQNEIPSRQSRLLALTVQVKGSGSREDPFEIIE